MPSKAEFYRQMAEQVSTQLVGSWKEWTAFLTTAARLYKYPFHEQMMIYAQRPDATACAEYDLWNDKMGRYVRRGSKGIALVDDSGDKLRLRYVFDISDTGTREHSRTPWLWQLEEQHIGPVSAMLERSYGVAGDDLAQQLTDVAGKLASEYWDDHQRDFRYIVDGSFLAEYDDYNIEVQFKSAATVSIAYALMSRCGLDTEQYFQHEDFMPIFDFNTPATVGALGAAVSQINQQVLRQIGVTVQHYEREQLAERSVTHGEQPDLHDERRLSDSRPEADRTAGEAPGQVRQVAESVPEGTPSPDLQSAAADREAVSAPHRDRRDSAEPSGADDAPAGERRGRDGAAESQRPDALGGPDEHLQSTGRGDSDGGAYSQLSFFLSEAEQIRIIDEAENVKTSSAFSFAQADIDHVLRLGGNTYRQRERIVAVFEEQKSTAEIADTLKTLYHGGNGIGSITAWYAEDGIHLSRGKTARYYKSAQVISWESAAERIGQLLQDGQFATNVELVEAAGYERSLLSERFWELYHDFSEEAREAGYLPSLANNPGRGFPEESAWLTEQLKSPEFRQNLAEEYAAFWTAYQQDRDLLRFHYHKPKEIWENLRDLSLPRTTFTSQLTEVPSVKQFISEDEIDAAMTRGSGFEGGKGRVFTFFQEPHTDKEKVDFLKHEYGIGGHSHALSGAMKSDESHDGKGLHYKKDGCPDVHFTWEKVAKRITDLIQKGRYLTEQEQAEYDKIQAENALAESEPELEAVGRIEYLGTNGLPGESVEYTDAEKFIRTIQEDTDYGVPITVVLYRDTHGNTIPQDFLAELDPPPKGFRVEDAPAPMEELDQEQAEFDKSQEEKVLADTDTMEAQQPNPTVWEYNGVKERHPDDMVLYQMGDFFELYGEDAKTAATELDLNLTLRAIPGGGYVEMCGFPANRLEQVVEQLRDKHDVTISAVPEGGRERQEYSLPSIDHEAEQHINAQETEFGADGTRVFRDTEATAAPTIRELHEQYKPIVLAAVMEDVPYRNACGHSDHENAVIEGNAAIRRAVLGSGNMELLRLYSDTPEFRQRLHREVIDETYPQLHELLHPLSDNDIDKAIQDWNGKIESKHVVVRYMEKHGREKDTAAWLAHEFDGGDGKTPFSVRPESPEGTVLPWPKVQRRIAQLIKEDRFYTEAEQDRFDNIDPIAIREALVERGIVNGQLVDEEKLDSSPFIQRVMADVERTASNSEPEVYTSEGGHFYQPGDFIDAATDTKGTVVRMVIDHVDEDYIWYTMPSVPDQKPVEMRREIFEKYLDNGKFLPVSALDLSDQPITIGGGKPAREISVTISDEEYADVRGFVRQRTSYDPTAPVYSVGDTVYLDDRPHQITELRDDTVQLLPTGMSYPIYRAESRERFEQLLREDNRNDFYTEFLPVNLDTVDQDLRDVLAHGLIGEADKAELSELLRNGKSNREIALWLSRTYPNIVETMELETGETADYRTMPEGIVLEVLDADEKRLAMLFFQWSEVAPLLRGMYARQLDGFEQEHPEPAAETPTFQAETVAVYPGDKNNLPYDVVVQTLRTNEPEPPTPAVEPEKTLDEVLDEHPVSIQVNGEWQTFPNVKAAEKASYEEYKANLRRTAENFHITDNRLGEGGPKAKFQDNVEAIKLLKYLEETTGQATPEQQEILSRYVGWGGLADAFDPDKESWSKEYAQLKELLTPEEYAAARGSTLNAHYTSPTVIKAIYEAVGRMGFETGYRARTRFSKFFNLPELMNLFKEVADIKTAGQLNLPTPEVEYHNIVAQPTEHQKEMVQVLSERASRVHSGSVDPSEDNMLKITGDGRKLGLDQRIINQLLPDEPGTKVNQCVGNIMQIWREGEADKLTQLVFCDISTPQAQSASSKKAAKALDNPTLHALEQAVPLDEPEPAFTIYEDIRQKLIAQGMPAEQIAFIHEAKTEVQKKELFSKVRTGQVRVLLGSTSKMGAGTNVQDRLVALHDLDCPWRPGDLAQRKGRIERQGNQNPLVHVYRYVTEGTFDAYLWQTVENKQKFISQIMTSKSPVRSCDDVDETALSFAEIKALCAGDPRIKERMDLDVEVARLKLMKADHQSKQYRLEDQLLKYFPQEIETNKGFIKGFEADLETLAAHPHPEDGFAGMEIRGDVLTDKENAGAALLDACKEVKGSEPVQIGSYRGFTMSVEFSAWKQEYTLLLKGQMTHRASLGTDPRGNLTRIDNALAQMPQRLEAVKNQLDNLYQQQAAAKEEIGKPFPFEDDLRVKSARLVELDTLLNIDGKGHAQPETVVAKSARPSVLDSLKRPVPPRSPEKKPKQHEEVR